MRLIDAETLKTRIGELCLNNSDMFSVGAYERIIGVIEAVPKVDVHPFDLGVKTYPDDYCKDDDGSGVGQAFSPD